MKIINITEKSKIYTANVFYILGNWNRIEDANTLVDVGRDPAVIKRIMDIQSGLGKKKLCQVVLTHCHYDHASLLPHIRQIFSPVVYAASPYLEGVDHLIKDGETIKIGDEIFELIHTPGHSSDSICLYCESEGVLFAGDTPVSIRSSDEIYEQSFIEALEKLSLKDIRKIYPGHGDPITGDCRTMIHTSLENARRAQLRGISEAAMDFKIKEDGRYDKVSI